MNGAVPGKKTVGGGWREEEGERREGKGEEGKERREGREERRGIPREEKTFCAMARKT